MNVSTINMQKIIIFRHTNVNKIQLKYTRYIKFCIDAYIRLVKLRTHMNMRHINIHILYIYSCTCVYIGMLCTKIQ